MMTEIAPEETRFNLLLFVYIILSVVNIGMEYWQIKWGIFLTKPLLLSLLSYYFYRATIYYSSPFRTYLLIGFIFSIFGDSFLMFVEDNPDVPAFFMLGLGSFLLTHIFYLLAFAKIPRALSMGFLVKNKGLIILFLLYYIGNILFLWSAIPAGLKIPVAVYTLAIISMAAMGVNLKNIISNRVFRGWVFGIGLFVISDSLIAIDKFHPMGWHIPEARVLIMVTYLTAQYFIARMGTAYINSVEKQLP